MSAPSHSIRAFSLVLFLLWVVVSVITVTLEVIPVHFGPIYFYTYKALKILFFFTLGYLTPITFWRFHRLGYGLCFAAVTSATVEMLQNTVGHGHKLSWLELAAKLSLIGIGCIFALEARYQRTIKMGRLRLALSSEHLPEHD